MSWISKLLRRKLQPVTVVAVGNSISDCQRPTVEQPMDPEPASLIRGWKFCATLQLRTPLAVLQMHGRVVPGSRRPPEPAELWHGAWVPQTATVRELGINIDEVPESEMSSDIGPIPVNGGRYLAFLLNVRRIVEGDGPVEARHALLRKELQHPEWEFFCVKLGGRQAIYDRLFPKFVDTVTGLPRSSAAALIQANLTTPAQLTAAPDAAILAIHGIGPAKLRLIRAACTGSQAPDSEYVDIVTR